MCTAIATPIATPVQANRKPPSSLVMTSSREIEHIAASWLARRDGEHWNERDQRRLDAWLDASTAHRVAYVRLRAAGGQPRDADPGRTPGCWRSPLRCWWS